MRSNTYKAQSLPLLLLYIVITLVVCGIVGFLIAEFIVHFCSRSSSVLVKTFSPAQV